MSQDKLLKILKDKDINAELIVFEESVKDSKSSASASKLDLSKIVKTILFKDKENVVYSAIIRSTERVRKSKVKDVFGSGKLDLISFDDVLSFVGYPAGGVPPFGYSARFVIDCDLSDDEVVLVGGGTIYSLFKLKVGDIKKLSCPVVADIRQLGD
ncbi:MAG: aminoacyl-tRNA deacylase [Candidatus Woesearchaeota archaeon]